MLLGIENFYIEACYTGSDNVTLTMWRENMSCTYQHRIQCKRLSYRTFHLHKDYNPNQITQEQNYHQFQPYKKKTSHKMITILFRLTSIERNNNNNKHWFRKIDDQEVPLMNLYYLPVLLSHKKVILEVPSHPTCKVAPPTKWRTEVVQVSQMPRLEYTEHTTDEPIWINTSTMLAYTIQTVWEALSVYFQKTIINQWRINAEVLTVP